MTAADAVASGRHEFNVLSAYSDLVTAYSRRLISFSDLTAGRRERLAHLKAQLGELEDGHPAAAGRLEPSERGNIFVIRSPRTCDVAHLPFATWLQSGAAGGVPPYPLLLDLLEAASRRHPTRLLETLCAAIACSWSDLERCGPARAEANGARWDDVHGGHGDDVYERYLINASALVLASLGPRFGVFIRHLDEADYVSVAFVNRLVREAGYTGLRVVVHTSHAPDRSALGTLLERAVQLPPPPGEPRRTPLPALDDLLTLCPAGIPASVADRLLPRVDVEDACRTWTGPDGQPWLYGPDPDRGGHLDAATRRRLHAAVFDAWPPSGWGYLRRAIHAIHSRSPERIASQHSALVYGLRGVGRDCLYQHYRALCADDVLQILPPEERTNALIGAARLAAMTGSDRTGGDREQALRLYEQALTSSRQPVTSYVTYSIANTHASRRDAESLGRAEAIYARGMAALEEIPNGDDRVYSEIRFLNGLALVRYLQRRDADALGLERRCLDLAARSAGRFPTILEWARDLINANASKVYERRLHQPGIAVELLEESLRSGGAAAQEHSRVELGRISFDRRDYEAVVERLGEVYGAPAHHLFDEPRELLARMMLALSLLALGRAAEAAGQVARLAYLCHSAGTPAARDFLERLSGAVSDTKVPPQ